MKMWLKRIPTTLVDEINRKAAATGSVGYAMQTAYADYNGHYVRVYYNDYRKYWLTEYQWGERVVLCRGTVEDCLRAGLAEYKRGAKGTSVHCQVPDEYVGFAHTLGYVEWHDGDDVHPDPRVASINHAMLFERQLGIPAISMLANSATVEEYEAKVRATK